MLDFWGFFRLSSVALLAALCLQGANMPELMRKSGDVATETISVQGLDTKSQYSVLYSISSLRSLPAEARVAVEISQGQVNLASKTLHAGDPDFYAQISVPSAGSLTIRVRNQGASGKYQLQVNQWPLSALVRRGPNHRWQDAQTVPLGETVFASGDEAPYIPLPGSARDSVIRDANRTDWYRIHFAGPDPKLVFFQIELTERDQVPVDVSVHRVVDGKLEEFFQGEDPVTLPHEVQALPGNKFVPRLLEEAGDYYVAVRAAHPEYKLRTRVYAPPPYKEPSAAVRTALDYVMGSGDSWHANTPRRGGILDRTEAVHQETSLCVACHATHFPLRAQLYATRQGYPVVQRQQVQFLTERFYNNPRPFYGFEQEGVNWARMISAAANVLGRMSHLLGIYEENITGERRASFHDGVTGYLDIYYAGRDKLPGDETNGNTPLVSAHEVAWYAWSNSHDARLPGLIASGEVKNLIDLCYQTQALAEMDAVKYREKIDANAKRILSLQRPDGQWAMQFKEDQPEVEFQTGHAVWALQAAGIPADHPQVAKAIRYLLGRQQSWGGWLDPLQSYENFRTPFRETQMSILALSAYFPAPARATGWDAQKIESLSADPVRLLQQLDNIWEKPNATVLSGIVAATKSNDALIRQAAVEALGRLGEMPDGALLGDPSKLVQRTAAWAMRQAYSRRSNVSTAPLLSALASPDDRVRWGALRVFQMHFAALAQRPEIEPALAKLLNDESPVNRMEAARGLWQYWFWSADPKVQGDIEDKMLVALGKPQHPWVRRQLRHAIYNIADENIRYLYNNWVPSIAREDDRSKVIRGRLAVEARLSAKFAEVLETGSPFAQKELLHALTELPLRRADIYNLDADISQPAPPVYNRIGNDIEQITFFGDSAETFAAAVRPLLSSKDPEMRILASQAVLMVKPTRFGAVNAISGETGSAVKTILAKVEEMPEAAEVAAALKPPAARVAVTTASGTTTTVNRKLDETFYRGYVQPILEKRGKDGYACVHCHASHAIFNGTLSTIMKVVNLEQPENSLVLLKPTSNADSEGVAGAGTIAHGGGLRWPKDSPEYVTILEWIRGAKE